MKKKICLVAAVGLLLVCGCSSEVSTGGNQDGADADDSTVNTDVDIDEAATKMLDELTFEDTLSELADDTALAYYGIEADDVADSVVMVSTGATAEEIAIFEATDSSTAEEIKEACEARKEKQITSYNDYKPSEVNRLEDAIIDVYGSYVVYCVVDDTDKAEEILDTYFK